jgi:hypothetical protein
MSCGTRVQDVGPGDPDGARLLRSSLWDQLLTSGVLRTAGDTNRSAACDSTALRQPAPSPVLRLPWLGTPLPNLPVRASAADAFTEVLLTYFTAGSCELHLQVLPLRSCSRRPLITAGHPVRSPVPSPSCNNPGFATPPPHRPANCTCGYCSARQFVSARPCCLSGLRENHNHATGPMSTPTNTDFRAFDSEVVGLEQRRTRDHGAVTAWLTGRRRGHNARQAEPDNDPETGVTC